MKAIILGATSGIGKSIADNLENSCDQIIRLGSKDVDTSSIKSVDKFCKKFKSPDILVLNTGGPPDIKFHKMDDKIWINNFNNFFCLSLR